MTFFTDIDNTAIYSHRHECDDRVWVEELNGRLQSFMTRSFYDYFEDCSFIESVPVTTRTVEQYKRLKVGFWHRALVCNGAILLCDGEIDTEWKKESEELAGAFKEKLDTAFELVAGLARAENMVDERPFMFYVKSAGVKAAEGALSSLLKIPELFVEYGSRKLFCIPKIFNKGTAIERYKRRFFINRCIAAGDSIFDVPMRGHVDMLYMPDYMAEYAGEGITLLSGEYFSDSIIKEIIKLEKRKNSG